MKGLTLTDWYYALPYANNAYIDDLVEVLERMGIRLHSDEKALMMNFCSQSMSEVITFK